MKGTEFVAFYASKGFAAWEAAAFEAAKSGDAMTFPWVDVHLEKDGHTATVKVQADVFSVGEPGDFLRLPLTPNRAQAIANLQGFLLPTPLLTYRIWQTSAVKLQPTAMVPNKGASLVQYKEHHDVIESQRAGREGLVAGHKKSVVVSNLYRPGKVLIFGWYRPSPDVFDNGLPMGDPNRQPLQPHSNVHGDFYVDYSHGIRFCHPDAVVDGRPMALADLYQHPSLSGLVSHDGPVKTLRYPAPNAPQHPSKPPAYADLGLSKLVSDFTKRNT